MKPKKVFCSHSSADKPVVEAFATRLRQRGVDAWLDKWEIEPGDDIVAKINEGLDPCDAGLIFVSRASAASLWVKAEVSTLIYDMIQAGRSVIPVLLEPDAPIPALLRPRARRGVEELDAIVDTIHGRTTKPRLGPLPGTPRVRRFEIELQRQSDDRIDVHASIDGAAVATENGILLTPTLQRSYGEFLRGDIPGSRQGLTTVSAGEIESRLATLGRELGHVVFPGQVDSAFRDLLADVGIGTTIDLMFSTVDPSLLALPFEAARLSDGSLPALHRSVRVSRRDRAATLPGTTALASPLKILVAIGTPDEGHTSSAVLDLERELQTILDAVEPAARHGNAEVKILEVGHPEEIRRALAADAYHVLHLSGHGSPGVIELEDEEGEAVNVTARELADAIRAAERPLPLVFLASCHGGTAGSDTTSFAQALLREGIPLVLAMQTRVTDSYATKLAGWFYAELATRHEPLASQALAQARRALETERAKAHAAGAKGEHAIPEYATASLFLGGEETPILDYALDRIPLRTPPVHAIDGPVPQLRMDDLIGRRRVAASDTPRIARASEGRPSPTAPTTSAISQCRSFESRPRAT